MASRDLSLPPAPKKTSVSEAVSNEDFDNQHRKRTTVLLESNLVEKIRASKVAASPQTDYSTMERSSTMDMLQKTRQIDKMFERISKQQGQETFGYKRKYPSNSTYAGSWKGRSWEGQGVYTYPHGVKFYGHFGDTQRNGHGFLEYPMGQRLKGYWQNDKLISWTYRFSDGSEYVEPWTFCAFPDRRFTVSRRHNFRPPGEERLTPQMPPRKIPPGCYDVGEGFYNPKTRCIISAWDLNKIMRIPNREEENWIIENCRKASIDNIGYRPDLFEYWTNGTKSEVEAIEQDMSTKGLESFGETSAQ